MRHHPQQERGQRRVEQILNAAAEVFGEIGFELATTNAIAERAQTSIGSLYQFFPNKDAIIDTLSAQYAEELVAQLAKHERAHLGCEEHFGLVVDTVAAYYLANPGFRALFFGAFASGYSASIETQLYAPITTAVMRVVGGFSGQFSESERQVHAEIIVRAMGRLLHYYSRQPTSHQVHFLNEMKRLLNGYICDATRKRGNSAWV
jgi:AcrR family transcriptional regulator